MYQALHVKVISRGRNSSSIVFTTKRYGLVQRLFKSNVVTKTEHKNAIFENIAKGIPKTDKSGPGVTQTLSK